MTWNAKLKFMLIWFIIFILNYLYFKDILKYQIQTTTTFSLIKLLWAIGATYVSRFPLASYLVVLVMRALNYTCLVGLYVMFGVSRNIISAMFPMVTIICLQLPTLLHNTCEYIMHACYDLTLYRTNLLKTGDTLNKTWKERNIKNKNV